MTGSKVTITNIPLPQIPESFIQDYVKAEGKIDKVEVEYGPDTKSSNPDYNKWDHPKTNANHTVIIHKAEEKMYSRDEVAEIIGSYRQHAWKNGVTLLDMNKWLKENL